MKDRYKWSFYKTLEFLDSRKPNMEIKTSFFNTLKEVGIRLEKKNDFSHRWDYHLKSYPKILPEELLITSTFLNSKDLYSKGNFPKFIHIKNIYNHNK